MKVRFVLVVQNSQQILAKYLGQETQKSLESAYHQAQVFFHFLAVLSLFKAGVSLNSLQNWSSS